VTSSVIVAGARTPIGRLLGGLKGLSAAELGGIAKVEGFTAEELRVTWPAEAVAV